MKDFDEFDDLEEEYETIIMQNDNGDDVEFVVVDSLEHKGTNYMLIIEAEDIDNEESDAVILKETKVEGEDSYFEEIEDNAEFDEVSALFQSDDYDIEL